MLRGFGFELSHDVLLCADWGAQHSQTLTIHGQIEITFPDGLTSGPWSMRRPRSDGNLLCSTPVSALMHPDPGTRPELFMQDRVDFSHSRCSPCPAAWLGWPRVPGVVRNKQRHQGVPPAVLLPPGRSRYGAHLVLPLSKHMSTGAHFPYATSLPASRSGRSYRMSRYL